MSEPFDSHAWNAKLFGEAVADSLAEADQAEEMISRLRIELADKDSRIAELERALRLAHSAMQGVTVFVTSREKIKEPEGRVWWAEKMADVLCACQPAPALTPYS